MIYIIDDDEVMADCIATATKKPAQKFTNAIDAMNAIDEIPPSLIFLDILLDGPDGFTFLNELMSYPDLMQIPIVIVSSIHFNDHQLKPYNVVKCLDKSIMLPSDIEELAHEYT